MMQEFVESFFSHLGVGQLRDLAGAKWKGTQTPNWQLGLSVLSGRLSVVCI